jgi:hypothetical protein
LPEPEASAFRQVIERLEAGENFEVSIGLPSDWRCRERDRQLRMLRSFALSSTDIERELRQGVRSSFAALVVRITRLDGKRILCARQIRRIVG